MVELVLMSGALSHFFGCTQYWYQEILQSKSPSWVWELSLLCLSVLRLYALIRSQLKKDGGKKDIWSFHSCDTAETVTRSQIKFSFSINKLGRDTVLFIKIIEIAVCFKVAEYSSGFPWGIIICEEAFKSHVEWFSFFLSCSLLHPSKKCTTIIVLKLKAIV